MKDRDIVERLRAARWPESSPDLRARVAAIPVRPPAISWSDRIWFSRQWRFGFIATVVAVVLLDIFATPMPASMVVPSSTMQVRAFEDVARSAGLPDDAARSIASRAVMSSPAGSIDRMSLIPGAN